MFSPVATDIESEIAQQIARLELFFEYNDSHPHFIECVKNKNVYLKKFRTSIYYRVLKNISCGNLVKNQRSFTIITQYRSVP